MIIYIYFLPPLIQLPDKGMEGLYLLWICIYTDVNTAIQNTNIHIGNIKVKSTNYKVSLHFFQLHKLMPRYLVTLVKLDSIKASTCCWQQEQANTWTELKMLVL